MRKINIKRIKINDVIYNIVPANLTSYVNPSDEEVPTSNAVVTYVDNEFDSRYFQITSERFFAETEYLPNAYTDITFNITKEGWTPICIMPRTSGRSDVVIIGYGYGETDDEHQNIDYSTATITFRNITDAIVTGGAKLDVIYMRHNTANTLIDAEGVSF